MDVNVIVQVITTVHISISHCKKEEIGRNLAMDLELVWSYKLKDRVDQGHEVRGCGMEWWNGMVEWTTGMVECFIGHI